MEKFTAELGAGSTTARFTGASLAAADSITVAVLGSVTAQARAEAILAAYRADGALGQEHSARLAGHVILDSKRSKALVVSPRVGLRQIYWGTAGSTLRLASEPAAVNPQGAVANLAPDTLFQYVYFHSLPGPGSAFAGVAKLNAGHCLEWNGSTATTRRYWQPEFFKGAEPSLEAMTESLRHAMEESVGRALAEGKQCGAFLSGGLDSSTVAGFAAKLQPGISTVSMGFDAQGYDEMEYARIASRRFGTKPLEYYVTPEDVVRYLPDIAASFAEPFGNSSAAAAFHCARIAREHGIDTLLAGDGGDEIFGGNDRYAKQLVFERYGRVPAPVRGLLESVIGVASKVTTRFPIGKAKSYIEQASVPLPDRLQSYNFLHRIAPIEVFEPEVLNGVNVDEPLRMLREEYHTPADANQIDRMLFLDWKFTLHDNDLVKVNTMCDLAGVQVVYPMLDPALIDFSMRIPSHWKVKDGELRWFYKRAMGGFLPDEIINKTKHGFGLPFGTWTRSHKGLQDMAADALDSLAKRRYFKPAFIKQTQQLHREGHASYYGELVWILMVLELWLQRHMPRAGL
jgi:asparagine synthase (glutamine-hydrolysing)